MFQGGSGKVAHGDKVASSEQKQSSDVHAVHGGGPLKPYVHDYNDAEQNGNRWHNGTPQTQNVTEYTEHRRRDIAQRGDKAEFDEQSSMYSSEMEHSPSPRARAPQQEHRRDRFLSAQSSESMSQSQASTAETGTQQ